MAQKTFTIDVISHKAIKNEGQKRSVYKRDHHPAIVSRKEYIQALLLLKSKRGSVYFNPDYMVRVIRDGLLAGFIPVNPAFGGYSPTHYMGAYEAANIVTPPVTGEIVEAKNAMVARIQEFAHSTLASVTISYKEMRFNADCVSFFEDAAYAELLLHPTEKLYDMMQWVKENKYRILAHYQEIEGVQLLVFNLCECEMVVPDFVTTSSGKVAKRGRVYLPGEWENGFGMPLVQHSEANAVELDAHYTLSDKDMDVTIADVRVRGKVPTEEEIIMSQYRNEKTAGGVREWFILYNTNVNSL